MLLALLLAEPVWSFSATSPSAVGAVSDVATEAPPAVGTTSGAVSSGQLGSGGPYIANTSRIARRAAEVASVAVLDVALPLIASAARFASASSQDETPRGWDAFWSSSTTDGKQQTTNAQRVAAALENLGPTFVKFGQALSSRPDIVPQSLAAALAKLQDDMEPFDTDLAKDIVLRELLKKNLERGSLQVGDVVAERWEYEDNEVTIRRLVDSLSSMPIAAASVGQVYKGELLGYGPVAVKVRRPGIEETVDSDYALLRTIAQLIESIPALPSTSSAGEAAQPKQDRLVATELVAAIDEFMGRLIEELDYKREEQNARKFASLYLVDEGTAIDTMPDVNGKGVVVPEFLPDLCTDNVLVMSWVEGTKLTEVAESAGQSNEQLRRENLGLIELATQCTLSQLLDTGTLHADPHGGNLLKVIVDGSDPPRYRLAYLDYGIVSYVPSQVRDGLVCAVAALVFAGDTSAVADLFGELQLIPQHVLDDPTERQALQDAMKITLAESLKYPDTEEGETAVPVLLFDKLLDALSRLVPRFQFDLPPYFINNARALSTLEGIARTLDPSYNVLQVMYPTALNRMMQNPSNSPVVDETLQNLIRSKETGRIDRRKISKLLRDSALISGYSRRKVLVDVLKTRGGRRLIRDALREELHRVVRRRGGRYTKKQQGEEMAKNRKIRRRRRRVSNYFRL